ncbi:restriction endonuclease subunit S [Rothia nasimurium]|uniref:restriction endonuclease subunit S n=1 Tax=Rothia nasimurium TaxID=85336 RepID=UPI001F030CBB|nr:restriction endonuclease subunit S [Rothia nasimurium]
MGRSLPLWPFLQEVDIRAGKLAENLPLLSVSQTRGVVRFSEIFDKEPRAENLSNYKLVEPEDLVINRMSADKGALGIASERGIASPDYMVLRSKGEVSPKYIAYLLKSDFGLSEIKKILRGIGTGDTNTVRTPRISRHELLHIKWPNIPVLEDQKRIADELDRELAEIDEFIADQQRLLELATEKFNAELRQLTYPANTPTVPLKRFAQITLGKMITPSDKGGMELAPYIRAANIQPGGVFTYQSDQKTMWFSSDELAYLDLKKDDVLVVEGGAGFGRSAVLTEDLPGWSFQNSINRVRVNKELADQNFINFCLQAQLIFGELNYLTNQSTIPHLTAEKLSFINVPDINLVSQLKISKILLKKKGGLTQIQEDINKSVHYVREFRKSLIDFGSNK